MTYADETHGLSVARRRAGEPYPDLTSVRIVHRAWRDDLRRLADLAAVLRDDTTAVPSDRAEAIRDYITMLCDELALQGRREVGIVWPVVDEAAGGAIDMDAYVDERRALVPLVAGMRTAAEEFARASVCGVARLAAALAAASDAMDLHFCHLEQDVLPVISTYVSVADYGSAERRMWRTLGLGRLAKVLPWLARVALPAEERHLKRRTGLAGRFVLAVFGRSYENLERRVFGAVEPASG
ncbi:hemerythrin domain-containing protein [Nonomuraea lactucae]|uniref:hemerythrin domain-containing protein n=1 Tax=Nonomuraea lactucae TaxID=2249762 RepID=UPI000DE491E6|nr:hemerythrin domain-containing protein [Nonomuraea lactucae]